MVLYETKGNLFDTKHRYIAHGCNAQGVMGSGVAKQIREKFPRAYEKYQRAFDGGLRPALGEIIIAIVDDRYIFNLITQQYYGKLKGFRFVSYDAVYQALYNLRHYVPIGESVAMPRIGCGLGGGDWSIIKEIINKASGDNYRAVVYEG